MIAVFLFIGASGSSFQQDLAQNVADCDKVTAALNERIAKKE